MRSYIALALIAASTSAVMLRDDTVAADAIMDDAALDDSVMMAHEKLAAGEKPTDEEKVDMMEAAKQAGATDEDVDALIKAVETGD